MSSLSPEEKRALRQSQGLLFGTQQWSLTGLRFERRRSRGALYAAGLGIGLAAAAIGLYLLRAWGLL